MEVLWNTIARREWEAYADQAGAGLQQRWSYGDAVRSVGGQVARVGLRRDGRMLMIAQVLMRSIGGLVTRGPIWVTELDAKTRAEVMREFRKDLRERGVRLCAVTPPFAADDAGFAVMTPSTLAYLPVDIPSEDAMHGKWRNRLRKAEASGLHVTRLPNRFEELTWLINAEQAQQKLRGYRALPASFMAAWLANDKSSVLTLAADQGDAPLAAMMFLRHGNTATYHLGWSSDAGRKSHAHNLLLWKAIKRLSTKGVQTLDLGTLETVNAPGLARFKLGSGAKPHRLGATRILI